jgi:serine/threonine protein kinase
LHELILKGKYSLKDDISQEVRDLLKGMLERDPKKRLTSDVVLEHVWFKDMDMDLSIFNDSEKQ